MRKWNSFSSLQFFLLFLYFPRFIEAISSCWFFFGKVSIPASCVMLWGTRWDIMRYFQIVFHAVGEGKFNKDKFSWNFFLLLFVFFFCYCKKMERKWWNFYLYFLKRKILVIFLFKILENQTLDAFIPLKII